MGRDVLSQGVNGAQLKKGFAKETSRSLARCSSPESIFRRTFDGEMGKTKEATTAIDLLLLLFLSLSFFLEPTVCQGPVGDAASGMLKEGQEHSHVVHCSRERSRAAWQAIEEYLMPFVERENYQIPRKCRLHHDNDMFRDQEQHKIRLDMNDWRCGYCKKSFQAEKYLDQHFDNRHLNLLDVSDGKCLADLCGALHCDFVIKSSKSRQKKCNPAAAAKNRHLCESLADSCFPLNQGPSASRLHDLFLRQFCDSHTCSGKVDIFPKGGNKRPSIFYIASGILSLMLLPLFYLIVYLYQREMRKGTQELRRIPRAGLKTKPS